MKLIKWVVSLIITLIRTTLLQQDRFRKLNWLPSSVAFGGARVIASGSFRLAHFLVARHSRPI